MIALQEELDWECYHLYSLLSEAPRYRGDDLPELSLGQRTLRSSWPGSWPRAKSQHLGSMARLETDHRATQPLAGILSHAGRAGTEIIETNKEIGLIERPEYKRRWNDEPWEDQEQRALKNWLLDRLEAPKYRKGTKENPELTTIAQMADVNGTDLSETLYSF